MSEMNQQLAELFTQIADAVESGEWSQSKIKVGITLLGSEHGVAEVVKGAEMAAQKNKDIEVLLIGPQVETDLTLLYETSCEKTVHEKMEEFLKEGRIDACVTMHYNFPIGVSTVGRVITPGFGRELIIATTTGTSGTHRVSSMLCNAIHGIMGE